MMNRIEQIGKIVAILAGLFAVYQYWNDIQQQKKGRSYSYADKYIAGEVLEAKYNVDRVIADLYRTQGDDDALPDLMIRKFVEEGNHNSYYIILLFFETVYKCDIMQVCNKDTTVDLFKSEAERIYRITSPVMEYFNNTEDIPYGHGLKCIAKGYRPKNCRRRRSKQVECEHYTFS